MTRPGIALDAALRGTKALANDKPAFETMRAALHAPLESALGQAPHIEYLCAPKPVDDDPVKLLVRTAQGDKAAVVLVSAQADPGLVERGMRRAEQAKAAFGDRLGAAILVPLIEGRIGDLTYAALPYCHPLDTGRLRRRTLIMRLAPSIYDWLADAVARTAAQLDGEERKAAFVEPLEHVADHARLAAPVRACANRALESMQTGAFEPRLAFMHGDFWIGNLLLDSARPSLWGSRQPVPFRVIDWPGARLRGHAIYDTVRLGDSFGTRPARLREEVAKQCRSLGCAPDHAVFHLLAALGHIGTNLGEFPEERYIALASRCYNQFKRIGGG